MAVGVVVVDLPGCGGCGWCGFAKWQWVWVWWCYNGGFGGCYLGKEVAWLLQRERERECVCVCVFMNKNYKIMNSIWLFVINEKWDIGWVVKLCIKIDKVAF